MIYPTDILSIETWILIGTLLGLGRYYLHRKWQYFSKMGIPYESPSLLNLGNIRQMFGGEKIFTIENENKKKYGPIWGYFMFTTPYLTIHDLEMLRRIYIQEFANFSVRQSQFVKINGKELNAALTSVDGADWKRTRSSMTPTFSTSKLKQMTSVIEWCSDNAIKVLERKYKNGDGTFNPKDLFSRLSLDIVCSAAFSSKVNSTDDTKEEPRISVAAKELFQGSIFSPLLMLVAICPWFESVMDYFNISIFKQSSLDYFKNLTHHVIKQREDNTNTQNRVDLMQLLLDSEVSEKEAKEASKGMTRNEIIGNSMLMVLAGYDNVSSAMGFLAYNLAQYPVIQIDVQKEIDEMVETHGKFDYEGVNSLKLLDMCLNETMRLYNPVIKNSRICTKECTINGLTIPKGMAISIPTFALSRDPEYWEDPTEFNPERMRDMSQVDPMIFQPFGAGPRNCIGIRFALMEIKLSMCKILHKFSFKPAENTPKPPLELTFTFSVRPAKDFDLRAVPRDMDN